METPRNLTSLQNPLVKLWASLRDAKHRQKEQLFILEGLHLVEEALKSSLRIVAVCSSDAVWIGDANLPTSCERYIVTTDIVARCCSTETPQPTFAIAELPALATEFDWQKVEIGLLLDAIQDPGNLGAILRSAAAAGVDLVVVGDGCVDLFSPKGLRAAMGASFRIPVIRCDLAAALPKLKKAKCHILASVLQADSVNCFQLALHSKKVAWIVGNEGSGIRDSLLAEVDTRVTIPMFRETESLNVAQATAILLYESVRQKKFR
jgi:TrmH family RNA methyltransferase